MPSEEKSISGKILHNSFWYGLETTLETIIFFGTSIAVARYMGPEKMGYFSYVNFLVSTTTRTAGAGLASVTRKYMSEFLAIGRPGLAHSVYRLASRFQLLGALILVIGGIAVALAFGKSEYRLMSCILLLAAIPGVMSWVPAEANNAFEDVYPNTRSAFGYTFLYTLVIVLTIVFHRGLVGIASASLIGRTAEVLLRTGPLNRKLRTMPMEPLPDDLKQRIKRYCQQTMGLQILTTIVWDRSEVLFLGHYSSMVQVSFYSISVGLSDKLLTIPRTFCSAVGMTLMVESGRDEGRVNTIVQNSCRYLLLIVIPVNLGAAAIAKAAISVGYTAQYEAAGAVMSVAALLSIPKVFNEMAEVLLRAADRQSRLIMWLLITGVVNLTLDYLLIPRYAAVGAAFGNGLSQCFGVMAVWQAARREYNFSFPVMTAVRLGSAGVLMAVPTYFAARQFSPKPGLLVGVAVGALLYPLGIKIFGGLEPADGDRLRRLSTKLPGPLRSGFVNIVSFLAPPVAA